MGRKKRKVRSRLEASTSHIPRSSQAATSSPSGSIKQATAGKKRKAEARKMKPSISATCVTSSNRTPSAGFATADMRAEPTATEFLLADENVECRPVRYFIMKTKLAELSVPKHWSMVGEIASKFIFEERCTFADVSGPVLGVDDNLFIKLESVDDEIGVGCHLNDEASEMDSSGLSASELHHFKGLKKEICEGTIGAVSSDVGEDVEVLSSAPEPIIHFEIAEDAETIADDFAEKELLVPDEIHIIYPPRSILRKPLIPYTGQITDRGGKSRTVSEAVRDVLKTQQSDSIPDPISLNHNYLRAASPESVSSAMHLPYNASKLECKLCRKVFSCKGQLARHNRVEHAGFMNFAPAYRCGKCDMAFFALKNYINHLTSHDERVESNIRQKQLESVEFLGHHEISTHEKVASEQLCKPLVSEETQTSVGITKDTDSDTTTILASSDPQPTTVKETSETEESRVGVITKLAETSDTVNDDKWRDGVRAAKKLPSICDIRSLFVFNSIGADHHVSRESRREESVVQDQVSIMRPLSETRSVLEPATSFPCDVCGKVFKAWNYLKAHKINHENKRDHLCTTCGKRFNFRSRLTRHMRTHSDVYRYICEICGLKLKHRGTMNSHRLIHTGEKPYVCETCGMSFRQSSHLLRHKFVHSGERPHPCEVCEKKFKTATELRCHTRDYHTPGNEPAPRANCKKCGKSVSQRYMKWHLRLVHNVNAAGISKKCEWCGKGFKSNRNLETHRRTHTGEKPYVCKVCGKAFSLKASLQYHLRIHTGEKPYSCDVCNKKFRLRSSLNDHLRVHTGARPYECPNCDQRFKQRNHLKSHLECHNRLDMKRAETKDVVPNTLLRAPVEQPDITSTHWGVSLHQSSDNLANASVDTSLDGVL